MIPLCIYIDGCEAPTDVTCLSTLRAALSVGTLYLVMEVQPFNNGFGVKILRKEEVLGAGWSEDLVSAAKAAARGVLASAGAEANLWRGRVTELKKLQLLVSSELAP